MTDILLIKCNAFLSESQLQDVLNCLKAQKEDGVILLPPYLEAQVIPDDIEVKFVDINGKEI